MSNFVGVSRLLHTPPSINYTTIRCIGTVNKKRMMKGMAPRSKDGALFEGPDFSFMDGRGFAPLTIGQRRRYLRDKYFAEQIVKYMKQFELAKQLRPEEPTKVMITKDVKPSVPLGGRKSFASDGRYYE